ncbi:hypothetical protein MWU75_01215 [Ornithinimicrobium sp. F0845]|uniref:DUF47 domain-containing protein n=1 Tax=Ornithinimicrobium sp. F0845 TaxID=2926412 RepID=UPI001FF5D406|nr:hypothetical protein [Ornithinimicrobium sp. F0845]MCK0110762.1 hypothetical protein [Ornithinimicrobium sp. F0845]
MTDALTGLAVLVRDGAVIMRDSLGATSVGRAQELDRLRALVGEAGQARNHIVDLTRNAFVTPYDRGDIHLLAVTLAECLMHLERAVDGGIRHRIEDVPDGAAALVDALVRMAELTAQAMPRLRSLEELAGYPEELRRVAARALRVRGEMLTETLAAGADPLLALRTVVVSGDVANAVRAFEQVATVVEGIVVKES